MKTYTLEYNQFVSQPIELVFKFFEKPENLKKLTPNNLGFKILTPSPIKMNIGRLIDYTIRIFGINFHWRTIITDYKPDSKFADEQLKGPYSFWHHTHNFEPSNGGTQINDKVVYALPLGIFGRIAHSLFVRTSLHKIFSYRVKIINELFSNK